MAVVNPYNYSRPKGAVASPTQGQQNKPFIRKVKHSSNQHNNGSQYLEQKVLSASPEELTLMLYDGAIKFVKQAKLYNEEGNIEKTSNAILRAEAIYHELRITLNPEYDISIELDRLYEYVLHRLTEANITKNNDILDEVLELSNDFRDTWKQAMDSAKK